MSEEWRLEERKEGRLGWVGRSKDQEVLRISTSEKQDRLRTK